MKKLDYRNWIAACAQMHSRARTARYAVFDARLGLPIWVWMWLVLGAGLAVRLLGHVHTDGFYHPDEIGQYLEPAHRVLERTVLSLGSSGTGRAIGWLLGTTPPF